FVSFGSKTRVNLLKFVSSFPSDPLSRRVSLFCVGLFWLPSPMCSNLRHLPHSLDSRALSATHYPTVNAPLPPRPTIKDVARAANVSQSTVSYILNHTRASERISEETKRRV